MTAGVGVAVGVGRIYMPVVATFAAWFTLAILRQFEKHSGINDPLHDD